MYVTRMTRYPTKEVRLTTYRMKPPTVEAYGNLHPVNGRKESESEDSSAIGKDSGSSVTLTIAPNSKRGNPSSTAVLKPGNGALPRKTKFGLNAKRQIQRCGALVDMVATHPSSVLFLTGTLPGSTDAAMMQMACYSGYAVNTLKAWIAKRVSAKYDFYVWERQKRGALHLHYAVLVECTATSQYILDGFHDEWVRILLAISAKSGVDMFERARGGTWQEDTSKVQAYAQRVRKSVGAYLSKYCSKTANDESATENGELYYPSRWYGCSRPLLAKLREGTDVQDIYSRNRGEADSMHELLDSLLQLVSSECYAYTDKLGLAKCTVAYDVEHSVGQLKQWTHQRYSPMPTLSENLKEYQQVHTYLAALVKRYSQIWKMYYGDCEPLSRSYMQDLLRFAPMSITDFTMAISDTLYLLHSLSVERHVPLSEADEVKAALTRALLWIQNKVSSRCLTHRAMMEDLG